MASRHFSIKHGKVGRGKKHALYIAGQGNYAERDDVVFMLDVNMPLWARDGADFFDAADKMERVNGRTYTEFEFAIPRGISDPISFAQKFASERLGANHPYRMAVHDKLASDGGRNVHAHLMFTERKLDGIDRDIEHFFLRANSKNPAKGGTGKDRKWNDKKIVEEMRQEYSAFAKKYGIELNLRSNQAQGLDHAEPKIGPIHARSEQSKNRKNLISKVETIREERMDIATFDRADQKQKFELQQRAKERRKELWINFHKQRRSNYSKLTEKFKVSHVHQKEKLASIKYEYLYQKSSIINDTTLKFVERRAAISIANMKRITEEKKIRSEFEAIRHAIKFEQNEHYFEKYSVYLGELAKAGDEVALIELNRLVANKKNTPEVVNSILSVEFVNRCDPAHINLKFNISKDGIVTYRMHGTEVIRDIGNRVDLLQTDDQSIETALRLAQAKFGNKLALTGSTEFQNQVAMITARYGLKIEFADPGLNKLVQQTKQQLVEVSELEKIERNLSRASDKLKRLTLLNQRTQSLIRLNIESLQSTHELQSSYVEAQKIAKSRGFNVEMPSKKTYRGSVIAVTSHHAIQNVGKNKVIIHQLAEIQDKQQIVVGTKLEVKYQKANPTVFVEATNGNQRSRVR